MSYDFSLLGSRHILLETDGYAVTSVLGFADAVHECRTGDYDLFIICQSISHSDKLALIAAFQARSSAPILVLIHPGQPGLPTGVHCTSPEGPKEFLMAVSQLLGQAASAAARAN